MIDFIWSNDNNAADVIWRGIKVAILCRMPSSNWALIGNEGYTVFKSKEAACNCICIRVGDAERKGAEERTWN